MPVEFELPPNVDIESLKYRPTTTQEVRSNEQMLVAMTDAQPLMIQVGEWTLIGEAIGPQSMTRDVLGKKEKTIIRTFIRVLQHSDGRVLVFGEIKYIGGIVKWDMINTYEGFMIEPEEGSLNMDDVIAAIRKIGRSFSIPKLDSECIRSLTPVKA